MSDFTVTVAPGIIGEQVKAIGFDIARAAFKKQAEAMASIFRDAPQSAFATALNRRKSHRDYCQVRKVALQAMPQLVEEDSSRWAEWSMEVLEPPQQVVASALRCNGPPSRLVSKLSYFPLTHTCGRGQGEPQR